MDPFEDLLKDVRRHASAGRGAQAKAALAEALALVGSEPPTKDRAFALGRFTAGLHPVEALPLQARVVEIAWAAKDPGTARFWTEHLVNTALEAGRGAEAVAAVERLLAEAPLSAHERKRAEGWVKKLAKPAPRSMKQAAKPKAAEPKPKEPPKTGNVARWLTKTRLLVQRIARAEEVDPDDLAEVLTHLDAFARDLRKLGGDRGAHVLDDLDSVEDPQKALTVASGESDACARVEGFAALDDDASFAEVRALVEPADW